MALARTYRRRLHEKALGNHGYVTTHEATALGIPPVELRKLAARGGITRVARGVYRFDDIPYTAHDEFREAVLRVGTGAYLIGDAVLALHDLAEVNPKAIKVATPQRIRRELPRTIKVIQRPPDADDVTEFEAIPATTVAQALRDCRPTVMTERLVEAGREAARRGLIPRREAEGLLAELQGA